MQIDKKFQFDTIFKTREAYVAFRELWSKLSQKTAENPQPMEAKDILLYHLATGKIINKGFTPIRNKVKIENGQMPYQAFWTAWDELESLLNAWFHPDGGNQARHRAAIPYFKRFESAISRDQLEEIHTTMKGNHKAIRETFCKYYIFETPSPRLDQKPGIPKVEA